MSDREPSAESGGDPVVVHSVWNDAEAALLVSYLEAHGIPASTASEVPHSVMPLTVDGIGEVRILVPSTAAERARELVADYLAQGEQEEGPTAGEGGGLD
jgi:hypothetical protein